MKIHKNVEIDEALQALVQHGFMKVVENKNGEDQYELTAKGVRYVEAMPNKRKMKQILEEKEEE